jgi:uncharacterized membrane protein YadS
LLPGLAVTAMGTLAAGFLSDHYGAPLTLMALLIGLSLNFLSADARLTPGLALASRALLRWGIVLVGVRLTFGQIASLGPLALVAVVVIVAVTIAVGVRSARSPAARSRSAALPRRWRSPRSWANDASRRHSSRSSSSASRPARRWR